jgi:hypothetical protein
MSITEKLFAATQALGDALASKQNRDRKPVTLEELKVGVWRNSDNSSIRVVSLDPLEISISSKQTPEYQPLLLADQEALRVMLDGEGYSYETEVVAKEPGVVVDLDAARVAKGLDSVSRESEEPDAVSKEASAMTSIHKEIAVLIDRCAALQEEVRTIVALAQVVSAKGRAGQVREMQKVLEGISSEVDEKISEASNLEDDDKAELIQLSDGELHIDQALVATKTKRRDQFHGIVINLENLLARATAAVKPFEDLRPQVDNAVSSVVDAAEGNSKKKKTPVILQGEKKPVAETKAEPTEGSGEGGPGGLEEPPFEKILKAHRDRMSATIDTIGTPEDFVRFRRSMPKDSRSRRCYIDPKIIEQELEGEGKKMAPEEQSKLDALEDYFKVKAGDKFYILKKIDLDSQYDREQEKIVAATTEVELDTISQSWPKEPKDFSGWKEGYRYLMKFEQDKIDVEYGELRKTLAQNLEVRRQELPLVPAYQALDAFLARGERAQEKIRMFVNALRTEYEAYSEDVFKGAKAKGGTISHRRRWDLWQEQGGDAMAERIIVESLHTFDKVDPEEGKKIFQAIKDILQKEN